MAKQLIFTFEDKEYTLEYTRRTVAEMEKKGFIASDITDKPMTTLPALFAGAFLAHHRFVKEDVINNIYTKLTKLWGDFMRCMQRNKVKFFYALYEGKEAITDEYGNVTGEYAVKHGNPIEFFANISAAKGETQTRQFGENESYDKVIVLDSDSPSTPITMAAN